MATIGVKKKKKQTKNNFFKILPDLNIVSTSPKEDPFILPFCVQTDSLHYQQSTCTFMTLAYALVFTLLQKRSTLTKTGCFQGYWMY